METERLVCLAIFSANWFFFYLIRRNDAKTVSIVALACFHPVTKAQSAAIHFFLGSDDDVEADSEEEEERPNMKAALRKHTVTKKTASSQRRLEKTKKQAKKVKWSSAYSNFLSSISVGLGKNTGQRGEPQFPCSSAAS